MVVAAVMLAAFGRHFAENVLYPEVTVTIWLSSSRLSRRESTCNVVIEKVKSFNALEKAPQSKDFR